MEVKEILIIIIFSINLLIGFACIVSRDKYLGRPLGLLSFCVSGWTAAFLWERWTGQGRGPFIMREMSLILSPLWLSQIIDRKFSAQWLPGFMLFLVIIALPFPAFMPLNSFPVSSVMLMFGYGAVLVSLRHASFGDDAGIILCVLALSFGVAGLFSFVSIFFPSLYRPYDEVGIILGIQAILIISLRRQWIEQEKLLNHGMVWLVYAVISGGLLFIPLTLISWFLESEPPLWVLLSLVGVALISALGFSWLGPQLSIIIERIFFPHIARIQRECEILHRDLEQMRSRLQQAERLRIVGEMAAQVAHEIKNPLGPIKGYATLLLEDLHKGKSIDSSFEKGLNIIADEARRIDGRISYLLGLSRDIPKKQMRVDLNLICQRAVMLLKASRELKKEGCVDTDLCDESAHVVADGNGIEEAVYNLLLNAAQATEGKGRIRVHSRWDRDVQGTWFVIEVSDDGPGFLCNNTDQLFKPFYTTREEGIGLGLSIALTIIKSHGGFLMATNDIGGGARFIIRIPTSGC